MKINFRPALTQALLSACLSSFCLANTAVAQDDNPAKAHKLYEDNCASCHGSDHGGYLAPALNSDTLKGRSPTALRTGRSHFWSAPRDTGRLWRRR